MYEVSKHFYTEFLPSVIEAAASKGLKMEEKYRTVVGDILKRDEHRWMKGLTSKEAEELQKAYKKRYNQ